MWIATPQGFYSAVQHRTKPKHVMIRARARKDLVNLIEVARRANGRPHHHDGALVTPVAAKHLPTEADIVDSVTFENEGTADYPFRLTMLHRLWASALEEFERGIDYDNFKNAVAKVNPQRAKTYHGAWAAFIRIEYEDGWPGYAVPSIDDDYDLYDDDDPDESALAVALGLDEDDIAAVIDHLHEERGYDTDPGEEAGR